MRAIISGLTLCLAILSVPSTAPAQEISVLFNDSPCASPSFSVDSLTKHLALQSADLGWRVALDGDASSETQALVLVQLRVEPVACEPQADEMAVHVHRSGRGSPKPGRLSIVNLSDVPIEDRERTLAVALFELVRTSLAQSSEDADDSSTPSVRETPQQATPAVIQASPLPDPQATSTSSLTPELARPVESWTKSVEAHFAVRRWSSDASAFVGGGAALELALLGRLGLRVGLDVQASHAQTTWGRVNLLVLVPSVALPVTLMQRPHWTLGPIFEPTLVRAQGQSAIPGIHENAVWKLALLLGGRMSLAAALSPRLTLRVGGLLGAQLRKLSFTGGGSPLVTIQGLSYGAELGLGYAFH